MNSKDGKQPEKKSETAEERATRLEAQLKKVERSKTVDRVNTGIWQLMLRTSFIACYVQKTLVFLGMIGLRPPAEHFMTQQNNFQNLVTFFVFAIELWSEKKIFNENENKIF